MSKKTSDSRGSANLSINFDGSGLLQKLHEQVDNGNITEAYKCLYMELVQNIDQPSRDDWIKRMGRLEDYIKNKPGN